MSSATGDLELKRRLGRRHAMLVLALVGVLAVGAGSAAAEPPSHFVELRDFSFQSPGLTRRCGFPVVVSSYGTIRYMLRTDRDDGLVERDVLASYRITYGSPTSGRSFDFAIGGARVFDYPNGTAVGAHGFVTITGIANKVPGLPAIAGRAVFETVVMLHDPNGVPLVLPIGPPIFDSGSSIDAVTFFEAFCAALAVE